MKVLHIISSLKIGGAEQALCNLLSKLKKKGNDHIVAFFHAGPHIKTLKKMDIRTHHITGLVHPFDPIAFFRLRKFIKQIKPDILHTSLWGANIMGRILGFTLQIPVISDLHGSSLDEGAFRNRLDRWTAHLPSHIVAVSDLVSSTYQSHIIDQIPSKNLRFKAAQSLTTIRNGIDVDATRKLALNYPLTRAQLGLNENAFVIGAVGRLELIKSYDILIRGFKHAHVLRQAQDERKKNNLKKITKRANQNVSSKKNTHNIVHNSSTKIAHPEPVEGHERDIQLCIVGDGSQSSSLKKLVKTLGIEKQVIFTGFRSDAYRFYPLFDCFALSSQSEGLSIALLEAFCFGLPVITTHNSLKHDAIKNGIHGFLLPPNNPHALGQKIYDLQKNTAIQKAMKQENVRHVREKFDLEKTCKLYQNLYQQIIKNSKRNT